MEEYIIPHCGETPNWESIPKLELRNILWLPDVGIRMSQQLIYNAERLFIHQRAVEKNIRAEHREPLSPVCEDSCMEFFFMPENDRRYLNFEINPNGCIYLGFGQGRHDRVRLIPKTICELFQIRTVRTGDGWESFYSLPLDFLRLLYGPSFSFTPGAVLMANCFKCGDLTQDPHYLSWNTVTSGTPDFHRPMDFGKMVFG